jgi:hypothetical protein
MTSSASLLLCGKSGVHTPQFTAKGKRSRAFAVTDQTSPGIVRVIGRVTARAEMAKAVTLVTAFIGSGDRI